VRGTAGSVGAVGNFGKYQLVAELGRGGMGVVYLAVATGPAGFHKLLAVKELRHELLNDEAAVSMFLDEARIAARLNHPNLVQTLEVESHGFRRFITMEYLEGQPLHRVVRRARKQGQPTPLALQLRALVDVLAGLEYAHSLTDFDGAPLGLVHRDVSPQNVMTTYDGHIKLLDFGIATALGNLRQSRGGVVQGKASYMAPECVFGQAIDRRADVFAAGAMLWEAILWSRPIESKPRASYELSAPSSARRDVDPDLLAIVDRAMSGDRNARYPTALAMRDELEYYVAKSNTKMPSARELSAFVSALFAHERETQRALIDTQLRIARGPTSGHLLMAPLPRLALTPTVPPVTYGAPPPDSLSPTEETPRFRPSGYRIAAVVAALAALVTMVSFVAFESTRTTIPEASSSAPTPAPIATQTVPTSDTAFQQPPPPARDRDDHIAIALAREPPPVRPRIPPPAPPSPLRPAPPTVRPAPPAPTAPPAAVEAPTVPAAPSPAAEPTPMSAIAVPTAKPARDILKHNPYLE
jgi:serine/threonine protein kinase